MKRTILILTILSLLVALNAPTYAQDLFGLSTNFPAGDNPSSVFIADLDGDGNSALAVAGGGTVTVLMNLSDILTDLSGYEEL